MPNSKKHKIAGGLTGTATALVLARNERGMDLALEAIGGCGAGVVGGIIPDCLEPALNPHHRAFFHSGGAGGATAGAAYKWLPACQASLRQEANYQRSKMREAHGFFDSLFHGFFWIVLRLLSGVLAGLVSGYLSHLVLDSRTPMGIPLLGTP